MRKLLMPESVSPIVRRQMNHDTTLERSMEKDRSISVATINKPIPRPKAVEATIQNSLLDKTKVVEP
jgi:hypothetical protein